MFRISPYKSLQLSVFINHKAIFRRLFAIVGALVLLGGIIGGLQGESLFTLWVIIELNLLGFIIIASRGPVRGGFLIKYFLIQRAGSAGVLLRVFSLSAAAGPSKAILLLSLILKLGAAPLQAWFIDLIEKSP